MKNFNKRKNITLLLKEVNSRKYRVEVTGLDSDPTTKDFTNLSAAICYYNKQPHGNGISVKLAKLRQDANGNWTPSTEYLLK